LNFKWKASLEKPVTMNVLDMDGNGSTEPFIFADYFGESKPLHPLDRMIDQVPSLKKKFIGYEEFSKVTSFGELSESESVEEKKLTELRSGVFMSDEDGLRFEAFPASLQFSAIKDIEIVDDQLFYIGNEDRYVTELGPNAGWPGGVMKLTDDRASEFGEIKGLDLNSELRTRFLEKLDNFRIVMSNYKANPVIISIE